MFVDAIAGISISSRRRSQRRADGPSGPVISPRQPVAALEAPPVPPTLTVAPTTSSGPAAATADRSRPERRLLSLFRSIEKNATDAVERPASPRASRHRRWQRRSAQRAQYACLR